MTKREKENIAKRRRKSCRLVRGRTGRTGGWGGGRVSRRKRVGPRVSDPVPTTEENEVRRTRVRGSLEWATTQE